MTHKTLFACLVHEQPECVVDLVRNLRRLNPDSSILVYDGSRSSKLLTGLELETLGAVTHPEPRAMRWGVLHGFALDSMRFGLDHVDFDSLTIVDSDQLCLRSGFEQALGNALAGQPDVGLFGCEPGPLPRETKQGPPRQIWREERLWRPWFEQFPDGASKMVHWSFWPTTVFTRRACRELVDYFDADDQLDALLRQSKVWATEEVLFPCLVNLLGMRILRKVSSYDFVQYRVPYTSEQVDRALAQRDAFWLHPAPRRYHDSLRSRVREYHHGYTPKQLSVAFPAPPDAEVEPMSATTEFPLVLRLPLLSLMEGVPGWFERDEAELLIAAAEGALRSTSGDVAEVGSYCGRATVLLGTLVRELGTSARVHAIDPHDGRVGVAGATRSTLPAAQRNGARLVSSAARLERTLQDAKIASHVDVRRASASDLDWRTPLSFLLIDGLHDYESVHDDFMSLAPQLTTGGYVAFHDYAPYFPGVMAFVDELLAADAYCKVAQVRSLIVLRKQRPWPPARQQGEQPTPAEQPPIVPVSPAKRGRPVQIEPTAPLVSCIMPTKDRPEFVELALQAFEAQDYPRRELVVIDAGRVSVEHLCQRPRVRYFRTSLPMTLGELRNAACREAAGEFIAHWDDDDWYAPWRLSYQVARLSRCEGELNGLRQLLFCDLANGDCYRYDYPRAPRRWLSGTTLCYRREVWQRQPFVHRQQGEDSEFVRQFPGSVQVLDAQRLCVATIHARNTAPRRLRSSSWHRVPAVMVREAMGEFFFERFLNLGRAPVRGAP